MASRVKPTPSRMPSLVDGRDPSAATAGSQVAAFGWDDDGDANGVWVEEDMTKPSLVLSVYENEMAGASGDAEIMSAPPLTTMSGILGAKAYGGLASAGAMW